MWFWKSIRDLLNSFKDPYKPRAFEADSRHMIRSISGWHSLTHRVDASGRGSTRWRGFYVHRVFGLLVFLSCFGIKAGEDDISGRTYPESTLRILNASLTARVLSSNVIAQWINDIPRKNNGLWNYEQYFLDAYSFLLCHRFIMGTRQRLQRPSR